MDLPVLDMGLWSLLLLIGALHGWFLFLVLVFYFRRSQLVLGALIFVLSYNLFTAFLWQSGWIAAVPHLIATGMPTLFLVGPLYYWFFSISLAKNKQISWVHFVPAAICLATIIPFYMGSMEFKLSYINSKDPAQVNLPATRALYFGALLLQLAYYWIRSERMLKQQPKHLDGRKNKGTRSMFTWLRRFHYAFGIFWVVFLGTFVVLTFTPLNSGAIRYAVQFTLALLVHAIAYLTLRESILVRSVQISNQHVQPAGNQSDLKQKVIEVMSKEKPFLKRDLTLIEFSRAIGLSPTKVSALINQEFQSNFSEFINEYRVREALKLLQDTRYQHFKLAAIGREAGFKNKVSFNRVIKKHLGKTPSELRSSANKE